MPEFKIQNFSNCPIDGEWFDWENVLRSGRIAGKLPTMFPRIIEAPMGAFFCWVLAFIKRSYSIA
jgi:hypothetical protein